MYDDVTLQAEEGTVVIAQNALEYTPRGFAYYEVRYVINIKPKPQILNRPCGIAYCEVCPKP